MDMHDSNDIEAIWSLLQSYVDQFQHATDPHMRVATQFWIHRAAKMLAEATKGEHHEYAWARAQQQFGGPTVEQSDRKTSETAHLQTHLSVCDGRS